jgi:hypothetical protein
MGIIAFESNYAVCLLRFEQPLSSLIAQKVDAFGRGRARQRLHQAEDGIAAPARPKHQPPRKADPLDALRLHQPRYQRGLHQ